MKIKGIDDECFSDYKKPCFYIAFPKCSFKCDKECGLNVCQNSSLTKEPDIVIDKEELVVRYLNNPITKAIVIGGLEPFDSELDLMPFIDCVRRQFECNDTIVIYTGYTEEELESGNWGNGSVESQKHYYKNLIDYDNIIIKFGRFHPNSDPHYDDILGVELASPNQYAKIFNER